MSVIRGVLIDLSGTIHVENSVIPGAVQAVNKLRNANFPVLFVTNTTKEPSGVLFNRLHNNLGFTSIGSKDLFTSLIAARNLIREQRLNPLLLLEESAKEDFDVPSTNNLDSVVIGLSTSNFHYDKLNEAFKLLKTGNAKLIGIHKARYFAKSDGSLNLGPGCFIEGLEYSTDVKATIVGKPSKDFFLSALNQLNVDNGINLRPNEVIMIGDDVRDDVLGAQLAGFQGALVKTGKYTVNDELGYDRQKPNYVFESVVEAINYILTK